MARVALLMGGWSAERAVSLVSGTAVAEALGGRGHIVTVIDVGRDLPALIAQIQAIGDGAGPEVVFNALHGRGGEDGTIQGVLDMLGLPYTHSGIAASAVAMDKPLTKRLVAADGVRSPDGSVTTVAALSEGPHPMAPPYVVKPACEGSSVGVRLVREGDNAAPVDLATWGFDGGILVEAFIAGRELTVGVMGDRALTVTEIRHSHGFFDYEAKYTAGEAEHLIPAPIPDAVAETAMAWALAAHRALGCRGISRSDFRWDDAKPDTDGLYFLEINTQPGFTPVSLVPEQAAHVGVSFAELCDWLLEDAQCR